MAGLDNRSCLLYSNAVPIKYYSHLYTGTDNLRT